MHASTPRHHPGTARPTAHRFHPPTARCPRPATRRLHAALLTTALALAAAPALPLAAVPPTAPDGGLTTSAATEAGPFSGLAATWRYWAERLFGDLSPLDPAAEPAPPADDEPSLITGEGEPPKPGIGPSLDPNGLK